MSIIVTRKALKMPVTTRSQSKNINTSTFSIPKVEKQLIKATRQQNVNVNLITKNPIRSWFISTVQQRLNEIEKNNVEKRRLNKGRHKDKARILHYDNIRVATEIMYFIEQYYPSVRVSFNSHVFNKTVYDKVHDFYVQIRNTIIKPETKEEKAIVDIFIYTLQDVEKMIVPYLPQEHVTKRIRKFVDYTGMDTIESYDEYDENY